MTTLVEFHSELPGTTARSLRPLEAPHARHPAIIFRKGPNPPQKAVGTIFFVASPLHRSLGDNSHDVSFRGAEEPALSPLALRLRMALSKAKGLNSAEGRRKISAVTCFQSGIPVYPGSRARFLAPLGMTRRPGLGMTRRGTIFTQIPSVFCAPSPSKLLPQTLWRMVECIPRSICDRPSRKRVVILN